MPSKGSTFVPAAWPPLCRVRAAPVGETSLRHWVVTGSREAGWRQWTARSIRCLRGGYPDLTVCTQQRSQHAGPVHDAQCRADQAAPRAQGTGPRSCLVPVRPGALPSTARRPACFSSCHAVAGPRMILVGVGAAMVYLPAPTAAPTLVFAEPRHMRHAHARVAHCLTRTPRFWCTLLGDATPHHPRRSTTGMPKGSRSCGHSPCRSRTWVLPAAARMMGPSISSSNNCAPFCHNVSV